MQFFQSPPNAKELVRIPMFKVEILALHVEELPKEFKERYTTTIFVFFKDNHGGMLLKYTQVELSHIQHFIFVPGNWLIIIHSCERLVSSPSFSLSLSLSLPLYVSMFMHLGPFLHSTINVHIKVSSEFGYTCGTIRWSIVDISPLKGLYFYLLILRAACIVIGSYY